MIVRMCPGVTWDRATGTLSVYPAQLLHYLQLSDPDLDDRDRAEVVFEALLDGLTSNARDEQYVMLTPEERCPTS